MFIQGIDRRGHTYYAVYLRSVLGLHPQYVRTKEHVLGNIFVCLTAFQLRSILKMKINKLNKETRTLIEVFGMTENKILPEVDTENFK